MNLHPIFQDCVAREMGRYKIETPWVAHGYAWATNGRISVRQPCDLPESPVTDTVRYPDGRALRWDAPGVHPVIALPTSIPDPIYPDCGYCQGAGHRWTPRGRQYDCPDCDGGGKDAIERFARYAFSRTPWLAMRAGLLRVLIKHGVREIEPVGPRFGNGAAIYRFRLGDITGLVGGLGQDDENENQIVTDIVDGQVVPPKAEAAK